MVCELGKEGKGDLFSASYQLRGRDLSSPGSLLSLPSRALVLQSAPGGEPGEKGNFNGRGRGFRWIQDVVTRRREIIKQRI